MTAGATIGLTMMGVSEVDEAYRVPVREEDRIRAELALNLVAASTGVSTHRMQGRLIGPAAQARRMAIYLAYVPFGWPMDRVSHAFGLNRTTAANACRWVEDARDAPALDDLLERLEGCARQVLAAASREVLA